MYNTGTSSVHFEMVPFRSVFHLNSKQELTRSVQDKQESCPQDATPEKDITSSVPCSSLGNKTQISRQGMSDKLKPQNIVENSGHALCDNIITENSGGPVHE